jgi:hypothetical protein
MINRILLMAGTAVAFTIPSAAYAVDLLGTRVSAAVYCCTAPIEADRVSNISTATVGNGVEFPLGSIVSNRSFPRVVDETIDVGASSIDFRYLESTPLVSGPFTGYVFSFTGGPKISGVSVDPLSTFSPVNFSFTDDSVRVNVAGLSVNPSSRLLLNLALTSGQDPISVSEPNGSLLPIFGLLALGVMTTQRSKATRLTQ